MSHSKSLPFATLDVFTTKPFSGNPLAIVEQADGLSDQQMQVLAREYNLPETLFIQQPETPLNTAKVRIFTPNTEIPFAGHPTLGCAIFMAERIYVEGEDFETQIRLEEVAGLVPVSVVREAGNIRAEFTAPVIPYKVDKPSKDNAGTSQQPGLDPQQPDLDFGTAAQALGLAVSDLCQTGAGPAAYAGGPTFLFVPLASRDALSRSNGIDPLCSSLCRVYGATGIYTYFLDPQHNEVDARMFAPEAGIAEDPATGSASALLAAQLHREGRLLEGLNSFALRQGVDMGRPSSLGLEVELRQHSIEAVRVAGSAVSISHGVVTVPISP